MREIAEVIGRRLGVPVVSLLQEKRRLILAGWRCLRASTCRLQAHRPGYGLDGIRPDPD